MDQFIKDWFTNKKWWFNCSKEDDIYISNTYGYLLDNDYEIIKNPFAELVFYDQVPRHIFRNEQNKDKINFYLNIAIKRYEYIDISKLDDEQWCFAHLPFRHTNDIKQIFFVIELARLRLSNKSPIIHRFLKASYEKCPINDQNHSLSLHLYNKYIKFNIDSFKNILANVPTDKLQPIDFEIKNDIVNTIFNYICKYKINNIIMSLSGGSDSMVLFYILSKLNIKMNIVHINYCNRPSSYQERDFVVSWANYLGYDVYVRNINEINRDQCMEYDLRTTYESYTRNVRYNCYKNVASKFFTNYVVAMGHNKDDCLENIFQNIAHQTKYENLNGMKELLKQDDILFFRPLLDIPKDLVIKYAKEYNIPYLPTSTPEWSQRGKIRNNVVPCMDNYNQLFIPNLHKLSNIMSDMYVLAQQTINHFIQKFTMYKEKQKIIWKAHMLIHELENTYLFWNLVCKALFKNTHISKRALNNCYERVYTWKKNYMHCIKENIKIHLQKKITLILEPDEEYLFIIYFILEE